MTILGMSLMLGKEALEALLCSLGIFNNLFSFCLCWFSVCLFWTVHYGSCVSGVTCCFWLLSCLLWKILNLVMSKVVSAHCKLPVCRGVHIVRRLFPLRTPVTRGMSPWLSSLELWEGQCLWPWLLRPWGLDEQWLKYEHHGSKIWKDCDSRQCQNYLMLLQPCHKGCFALMGTQTFLLCIIQLHRASSFSSFSRAPFLMLAAGWDVSGNGMNSLFLP